MSARAKLTPEQITQAIARVEAGEAHGKIAASLGVHRATITYHATGGKATHYAGRPWAPLIGNARRLQSVGQFKNAAKLLRRAADLMEGKA